VTGYQILIQQKDGLFSEQSTYCNGSQSAIVAAKYCHVPVTTLRASPYSLDFRTLVIAKVKAMNTIGWATNYSGLNTAGAKI